MSRFLFFLVFAAACLSLPAIAKRLTYGFHLAKMHLDFPHHPEWEVPLDFDVRVCLEQPFHFIGKGAQCYVFASREGDCVVKLFRYDQPSSEEKILHLFNACKMAYDLLRDETGLLYIHLNPTTMHLPLLHCIDAVGRKYQIPLDQYRFAVQKKAKPLRDVLEEAKGDPKQMQMRIDQLIDLLQSRTAKGICNSDPSLSRNFGFLEDRAIEFDFGNYYSPSQLNRISELKRYTSRLRRWLKKRAPEWVSYLDQCLEKLG